MTLTDVGVKNAKPCDDGKVSAFPDGNSLAATKGYGDGQHAFGCSRI